MADRLDLIYHGLEKIIIYDEEMRWLTHAHVKYRDRERV